MIRELNPIEKLYAYCESVLAGEIIACKALVQAVERFYRDLAKPDFEYEFVPHVVNAYCRMIPKVFKHFEGEKEGEPFELEPWQVFLFGNVFGWRRKKDQKRRFKKVFCTMGRKGGKSIVAAIVEIILARLDGEGGAQVYTTATKMDQAKIVHRMVELMVKASPILMRDAIVHKNNISFPRNSFCRPLGSDRPFDGTNTHAVVYDELHAWQEYHRPFFETMQSASGTRTQPIEFIITTAGTDKSYIFHEELKYARGILNKTISDDRVFALIFELDKEHDFMSDDFDINLMLQANPNMGVSVPVEYYSDKINEARQKPSAERTFKLKFANQCASSVESAGITSEIWDAMAGELSDWHDSDGIGAGVDIGGQDDLAAYGLSAKFKIGSKPVQLKPDGYCPKCKEGHSGNECPVCLQDVYRYEGKTAAFIAKGTDRDLEAEPFRTWIANGQLTVCDFVISTLKDRLLEDCQEWGIEYVAYDLYNAKQLSEELEAEGLKPVKMAQTHMHFNEPLKNFEQEIAEGRFTPDESDEVFRWSTLNMALNRDPKDRVMPDKKHSDDKIDPTVAYLMARKACNLALPAMDGPMVF